MHKRKTNRKKTKPGRWARDASPKREETLLYRAHLRSLRRFLGDETLPPGLPEDVYFKKRIERLRRFDEWLQSLLDEHKAAEGGRVPYPELLLQAEIVNLGSETQEGHLVEAVSIAWFEIVKEMISNPAFFRHIDWRKLEEIIAGAYKREGWPEVVLTPRSGDRGRDVIAAKPGIGSIRIIEQVKAYSPGHLVSAEDVRALLGVLTLDGNVSKGIITTTSAFAPGTESEFRSVMPYRLELKDGPRLREWLMRIIEKADGAAV